MVILSLIVEHSTWENIIISRFKILLGHHSPNINLSTN